MFSKLVGNDAVKQTLKRLRERGRVPNSLLFAGPDGVGKLQFALELARTLICPKPADGEACGVCSVCGRAGNFVIPDVTDKNKDAFEKVFFGGHTDVGKVVPYKRFILIDAIRDLEAHANFMPYEAGARFFIVDDADKMNEASSNALLKTLEEPPATSYIFLITSRPDSLLATIRSRCQTLRFAPVSDAEIERFLIEERAYSHDEARLASRLARGSIGRALSIKVDKFRAQRDRMLSVISGIAAGDRASLFGIAEAMNDAKNKDAFEENLDILQSLIHDLWTVQITRDESRLVNTDLADKLASIAPRIGNAKPPAWLAEIDTMRENLIVNINRKIATDALFVKMAA